MGKAAKTIGTVAAIGATVWATGGFGSGAFGWGGGGWAFNPTFAGATFKGSLIQGGTAGLFQGGGLSSFSQMGSVFSGGWKKNASLGLSAISAGSSILGGMERSKEAALRAREEERKMRLSRLNSLQKEAAALKLQGTSRGAAIAKAAAQGQDVSGRSFMAFLDDQENQNRQQIDTIRVNAEAGIQTSQLRIRQYGSQGSAAIIGGLGGAARSLLRAA